MTVDNTKKQFKRSRQVTGASEVAQQNAATTYNQKIQSKDNTISLPISGNDTTFELITISSEQIKTQTTVFKDNARLQANLNEISVSDILGTIKERGQQYPAIGRFTENDKIEVLDGSRRRFACMLANTDFLIYVTHEHISNTDLKFLSNVANVQKPLSLFEKGLLYKKMLDDGIYEDAKELAIGENITESSVSAARSALELPPQIIDVIPSISDLGRPLLNELRKSVKESQRRAQMGSLEQFIKTLSITALKIELNGDIHPKSLNKLFVSKIVKFTTPEKQLSIDEELKKPFFKNGKLKAFVKTTKKGYQIDLQGVSEEKKAAILAAIELELKQ